MAANLPGCRRKEAAQIFAALGDAAGRGNAVGKEPIGQANGANLEAPGEQHLAALADEELGAAAADVDEHELAVVHLQRLEHAQVDQPGLLGAGNDLHFDAGLGPTAIDELLLVGCLAHRRGRYGTNACLV